VEVRGFLLAQQAQIATLQAQLVAQQERIEGLEATVATLRARLGQDSSNSSKPPSSDPPSAQPRTGRRRKKSRRKGSGRKAGAQKGHKGAKRALVPPDQVTHVVPHHPPRCRACDASLTVFHHWHALEREELDRAGFQAAVAPFRAAFKAFCEAGRAQDDDVKWRALGRELLKRWEAVFRFVDIVGLEPTNNRAERAIRAGVIWRRLTQGTRSPAGSTFVGRILSTIETCRQQDRDVYGFLETALRAHLHGLPPPSLLPIEATAQRSAA